MENQKISKKFRSIVVASAAVIFSSMCAASAATINFGNPGDVTVISGATGTFDNGQVSGSLHALSTLSDPVLTQDATNGIGISSHWLDDPAIEGSVVREALHVRFDSDVLLNTLMVGFLDDPDQWKVLVNGVEYAASYSSTGGTGVMNFGGIQTRGFQLIASGSASCGFLCFDAHDISLKSVDVSQVPLPAALPLMLVGLGGIAMVGRRKKA